MTMRHRWQPPSVLARRRPPAHEHPDELRYVQVAIILAVFTAVEVAVYYVDAIQDQLVAILMILMVAKFLMVAGWFMHLKFDSGLFTTMFAGGIVLAIFAYAVVLVTLLG